jgi:cystathionine beta-lyase
MKLKITPETVRSWISDKEEVAFIDVREIGQHTNGHPFFSISIPYSLFEFNIKILVPNKQTRVILIDNNNGISDLVYNIAHQMGYSNISIIEGGVEEWVSAGYKLFDGINVPSKSFGELIEKYFHTPSITAKELAQKQKNNENYIVIDGRPFLEYNKMSIPKSICCPNAELFYRVSSHIKDMNTEIIINCAGRTRSIIGAQTLINFGIKNKVKALENGTQGWFLSELSLEHNKKKYLEVLPNDIETQQLQNKVLKLTNDLNIDLIDLKKAQELIIDKKKSTFIFDVTTSKTISTKPGTIMNVPGGQLIQATDKYIGVWKATVILVDDGDLIRAGTTSFWLKKMGYEVYILKEGLLKAQTLKFTKEIDHKLIDLDFINLEDLVKIKKQILYDIRSSKDFCKMRIKNSIWLNRAHLYREKIKTDDPIIIITDNLEKASLIVKDLKQKDKGAIIKVYKWNQNEITSYPSVIDVTIETLSEQNNIDFNFHTHMRHDGNKEHAKQYLEWEINLVSKMDKQELSFFKLSQSHF